MAHRKSAIKRIRINREHRLRNRMWKSRLRTEIKSVEKATTVEEAQAALAEAVPIIDRTARRGVIHANAAARAKSRLHKLVQKLSEKE